MHATPQNILEAFNQLPETEKHALASEIIKQVAQLETPPLTDEALTEVADALFLEHDKTEAVETLISDPFQNSRRAAGFP